MEQEFGGSLPVLDGGECQVGLESTIVACLDGKVRVLRPGVLTPTVLSRACGQEVLVGPGAADPRVPGAVKAHYAPRTPLELVPTARLVERLQSVPDAALVTLQDNALTSLPGRHRRLPADAGGYGRALYATLRDLDQLSAPRVFVEAPPAGEAWAAVRDRLSRAAAAGELEDDS